MANKLNEYWGKKVKILDDNHNEWTGFVEGYTDSNNNPEKEDSIDIRIDGSLYIFFDHEIKNITVLV